MRPRALLPFHLIALSYATDYIGIEEKGGDNEGPAVELFLRAAGLGKGAPWCAAFVNFCAEMASSLTNERSPLELVRRQGYVQDYYDWAEGSGRLREDPAIGDLFVIWHLKKKRYAHIGFVSSVELSQHIHTVEGNTNEDGGREGYMVAERIRGIGNHMAFLRWA